MRQQIDDFLEIIEIVSAPLIVGFEPHINSAAKLSVPTRDSRLLAALFQSVSKSSFGSICINKCSILLTSLRALRISSNEMKSSEDTKLVLVSWRC